MIGSSKIFFGQIISSRLETTNSQWVPNPDNEADEPVRSLIQ